MQTAPEVISLASLLPVITHISGGYGTYGFLRNTLEIR